MPADEPRRPALVIFDSNGEEIRLDPNAANPRHGEGEGKTSGVSSQAASPEVHPVDGIAPAGGSPLVDDSLQGLHLLVTDDDPQTRDWIRLVLQDLGVISKFALDGQDAIRVLDEDWRPQLIISDVEMPGLNGIEFAKHLRESTELQKIPLIFLTAHDDAQALRLCMRSGAVDFFSKARLSRARFLEMLKKHYKKASSSQTPRPPRPPPPSGPPSPDQVTRPPGMSVSVYSGEAPKFPPVRTGPSVKAGGQFSLLARAHIGVMLFAPDGRLVETNAFAMKRLGFPGATPQTFPRAVSDGLLEFGLSTHRLKTFQEERFVKWMPGRGGVVEIRLEVLQSEDKSIVGYLVLIP